MAKITAQQAQKFLEAAPEGSEFITADGKGVTTLSEISSSLKDMNEDVYAHHVNSSKNDFATWVGDIFGDYELGKILKKSKSKSAASKAAESHINALQKIIKKEEDLGCLKKR